MPINIYVKSTIERVDWLCEDDWELPGQIYSMEKWLLENENNLKPDLYVADIGFRVRENASGGSGVLSSKAMAIMGHLGIDLYFSEYP